MPASPSLGGRRFRRVRTARLLAAAIGCVIVALSTPVAAQAGDPRGAIIGVTEAALSVPVGAEPDGSAVALDATLFLPATSPAPAVVLAHGFGGSKADLVDRARDLAGRGYVVLAYSARGMGASEGRVHLDDPAYEVADARALVDVLTTRSEVRQDGAADPRVGVAGVSYGGALALMLAATDPRIDGVVAGLAWHDLADAFFPQFAVTGGSSTGPVVLQRVPGPGPFKQLWASRFFGSAVASATPTRPIDPSAPGQGGAVAAGSAGVCGRFDPTVCRLFLDAAQTGQPSAALLAMLRGHSPRPLLAGLRAPTLLVQGMADTLFGLDHADATARALVAQDTTVAVRWIDGGHDGTSSTAGADEEAMRAWFARYLGTNGGPTGPGDGLPVPAFAYAAAIPRRSSVAPMLAAPNYLAAPGTRSVTLPTGVRTVATPPGGQPASVVAVPGLGGLGGLAAYSLAALPGQSAAFDSVALDERVQIVGSPRVRLVVTSTGSRVVLFASLWQVTADQPTVPRRLVAPLSVDVSPGVPTEVEVALAPATWTVEAGSRLRLLVTSTDSGYAGPREARIDRVEVAGPLTLPTFPGTQISGDGETDRESLGVGAALLGVLGIVGLGALARRRRPATRPPHAVDLDEPPLLVEGLVKAFPDGHRAVDGVSWRADRGQVVGLLGPNGAGKTTTLRMVLGLVAPDAGSVRVLGHVVTAGAPVLARVGALVEGPGLLPHLTGRANLRAYWAATGRPDEQAGYDEALDVAALGGAADRPVRSYSHGMRQRLGIAQAMLGRPDVLVLDEPTNGLDPPQIAAMRPILHRYAAAGRTVVVSSHLLAEVELTCSHVVVMHAGRVVAAGPVAELLDSADTTVVQLGPGADAGALAARLRRLDGVLDVDALDDPVEPHVVVTADLARPDVVRAVAATGVDVVAVTSRRHLEDVFLGVIAHAANDNGSGDSARSGQLSLPDRLRQVRAR